MLPKHLLALTLSTLLFGIPTLRAAETETIASPAAVQIDFARDVAPLFAKHCQRCHGPKKQESGYRLDVRAAALSRSGAEVNRAP